MDGRLVQLAKAQSLILVTEVGIVISVRLEQPSKTLLPILVTELGMSMDGKLVQSLYLYIVLYQRFMH